MPQWEKHIRVDSNKNLTAVSNYENSLSGYSIVIPKGEMTGVRGADIGFKQEENGTWSFSYDYLPSKFYGESLGGIVTLEVAKMRARAVAEHYGLEISRDEAENDEHVIEVMVPVAYRNKRKAKGKQ